MINAPALDWLLEWQKQSKLHPHVTFGVGVAAVSFDTNAANTFDFPTEANFRPNMMSTQKVSTRIPNLRNLVLLCDWPGNAVSSYCIIYLRVSTSSFI